MSKNEILHCKEKIIRILECKDEDILIIDCVSRCMPVWKKTNELLDYIPCKNSELIEAVGKIPSIENLDSKQLKIIQERYNIIVDIIPFVGDKKSRSLIISKISEEKHISKKTIRDYLCKYLIYMDIKALAPKITETRNNLTTDEINMRWGLNKFFYNKNRNSLKTAYTLLLKNKYCDSLGNLFRQYPSFYQFRYFYRKTRKLQNFYISRYGLKDYQKNKRPLLGDSVQKYAYAPGFGMVDSTICDIYLVNDAGQLVGRPVLTICVDAYSSLVMGYSLTWEGGTYSLRDMMLNTISNKVDHCKKHGIIIKERDWPSSVMPGKIISDQGTEYVGDTFGQITEIGVCMVNLPAYRPELKGPVEKTFDLIQRKFRPYLKGKGVIESDFRERGSHDYRKDACLTIEQFEKIIIQCILFCNTKRVLENFPYTDEMLDKGIKPYPAEIWRWGMSLVGTNVINVSTDELILVLLPRTTGKFTRYGLKVNRLRYYCEGYTEKFLKGDVVTVSYNPDNASYVWLKEKNYYVKFSLIEKRYLDMTMESVEKIIKSQYAIINKERNNSIQAEVKFINQLEMIVDNATSFNNVDVKNLRENRKKEIAKKHKDFGKEVNDND